VYITINDVPVEDLYMQLGEAGEAVFIEENDNTPINQPIRHLEPSNTNTFLDPDNAIELSTDINSHTHLSNIDCSVQLINKQLDKKKDSNENNLYEQESKPTINIDVLHSNIFLSTRRRPKRRLFNNHIDQYNKQTSEDDEQDIFNQYSSLKRRSRARKRESISITTNKNTNILTPT
ncbi:unnamed protein product, partial [Rotaria sp. Silwood1]